jgi:hypothetical protein
MDAAEPLPMAVADEGAFMTVVTISRHLGNYRPTRQD